MKLSYYILNENDEVIAIFKDEVYNLPFNMNTFSKIFNECDPEKIKNLIE